MGAARDEEKARGKELQKMHNGSKSVPGVHVHQKARKSVFQRLEGRRDREMIAGLPSNLANAHIEAQDGHRGDSSTDLVLHQGLPHGYRPRRQQREEEIKEMVSFGQLD